MWTLFLKRISNSFHFNSLTVSSEIFFFISSTSNPLISQPFSIKILQSSRLFSSDTSQFTLRQSSIQLRFFPCLYCSNHSQALRTGSHFFCFSNQTSFPERFHHSFLSLIFYAFFWCHLHVCHHFFRCF